jgi:YD repeat-containing protein
MSKTIKSVSLYRYDILENGLADEIEDWDDFLQTKTHYSEDGRVTKESTFSSWNDSSQVIEYIYDANNLLIEERYSQDDEEVNESVTYLRNQDLKLMKEIHTFLDGSEDITEYEYNDQHQLISKRLTNSDGETEQKLIFDYNGDLLVSETTEDGSGNLVVKTSYSYHENGTVSQSEQIIHEDGKSERLVNQFDENGQRLKSLKYNTQEQLIEINRFNYNDGRLTEIEDENQRGHYFIKFTYDDRGNILSQEEMNDRGEVTSTIERTFDGENRLLQATIYVNGMNYRPNQHYIIRYVYEFYN